MCNCGVANKTNVQDYGNFGGAKLKSKKVKKDSKKGSKKDKKKDKKDKKKDKKKY
jgi:uncharacterized protein YutD